MTKASARVLLRVELHGVDLPGRSCGPRPGGGWYKDIHVGLKKGTTAIDLVPGDAAEATWSMDVTVREIERVATSAARSSAGTATIAISAFAGMRGCLTAAVENFRAAKLRFAEVDPALIDQALRSGRHLSGVSCSPMSTAGRAVPAFIRRRSRGRSGTPDSGRDSGTFASAHQRLGSARVGY